MATTINIGKPNRKPDGSADEQERARFLVKALVDEARTGQFTDWEDNFVEDLAARLEGKPNYWFTAKQIDVLERIWKKG